MANTQQQDDSIKNTSENKLTVALPGSGKTHTTISYADSVLEDLLSSCLMVTFTTAAAGEMDSRVKKRLKYQKAKRVRSKTFASLFIEQFKPIANGRRMVMGPAQISFVRRSLVALNLNTDETMDWMSKIDNLGRQLDYQPDGKLEDEVYRVYLELLKQYKKVDLNIITKSVVEALKSGRIPLVRESHICIDEFQDTDNLQYEWMKTHGDAGKVIYVVGDDDQSIYSWRGSLGYENMVRFQRDLHATAYMLNLCFRCAPKILKCAQRLVEHNVDRIEKEMESCRDIDGTVVIHEIPKTFISERTKRLEESDIIEIKSLSKKEAAIQKQADKKQEAYRFVAQHIKNDLYGWAILCRTNKSLDSIESVLAEHDIPVVRIGGKSIFDNEHAHGIAKMLYSMVFPNQAHHLADALGWLGESEETILNIYQAASRLGFASASSMVDGSWKSVTVNMQELSQSWLYSAQDESCAEKHINDFKRLCLSYFKNYDGHSQKFAETILDICVNILISNKGNLFHRAKILLSKVTKSSRNKVDHTQRDSVILCTMNSSKGLEWPKVWIPDIEDGKTPLIKPSETDLEAKLEEERRLMFVAITRAEDELRVSYTEGNRSPFLDELEFGTV